MKDRCHKEAVQGIFATSSVHDICCISLGLIGYALFSTWGVLLFCGDVLKPISGVFDSGDLQISRIVFYTSLLGLNSLFWMLSTKVRGWWHRILLCMVLVFSMSNCLYLLLPVRYEPWMMWLAWGLTVLGYIALIFLWERFFSCLSSAGSAYFITLTTLASGLGFLFISYLQAVPAIICTALLPLSSALLYVIATRNLDISAPCPISKKEIFKTVRIEPFIASMLYSIPMGVVGSYLVSWGDAFAIGPLLVGGAIVAAGAVMFSYVNIPRFQELSAFWSLPVIILFLNLLVLHGQILEASSCTALVFFIFCRSTSNRRAVKKILSGQAGYPLGAHAYGRIANTFGVLLGWILGWISLETMNHEVMLVVFIILDLLLIVPGSFFLTNHFPSDHALHEKTKKGWWKRRCALITAENRLTTRQGEIMILLAKGRNSHYMAETLCLSHHTVRTHIQAIYKKLNVHSRQELLDYIDSYNPNSP